MAFKINTRSHIKDAVIILREISSLLQGQYPSTLSDHRNGVADSAIKKFGIKRQKRRSGISYNGNGHNGISHNSIFSGSGISYNENCFKGISNNVIFASLYQIPF
jgi:hypothetical protein